MTHLEKTSEYQFSDYDAKDEYQDFSVKNPNGLCLVAKPYDVSTDQRLSMSADVGDFRKWLQIDAPSMNIKFQQPEVLVDRHSVDIWLGLVYLGRDVLLPVFLSWVSSYLYDKMKGALRGDHSQVHLTVVYTDKKDGTCKKLTYEGDADSLKKLTEGLPRD